MAGVLPTYIQVQVADTQQIPELLVGRLRRQLRAELLEIDELIRRSGLHDPMTVQIDRWQRDFLSALSGRADEAVVFESYVALAQELLTDPVTGAPLDKLAVLGSDGHTYGQLSLAVYQLSMPPEYKNRSPLNSQDEAPFITDSHPVVRHMTRWLETHQALLYSEELEQQYLHLLEGQQEEERQVRIDRIAARVAALERAEAQHRAALAIQMEQQVEYSTRLWRKEIEQAFIPQTGTSGEEERFQERLQQMALQGQNIFERLRARMVRMSEQAQDVQGGIDALADQDGRAIEDLRRRVQENIRGGLEHVARQIDAFEADTERRIDEMQRRDEDRFHVLQEHILGMRQEIDRLRRENQGLEERQRVVGERITQTEHAMLALQHAVNETRIAVQEMKERQSEGMFATIALVGVCIFATWAANSILMSSTIKVGSMPTSGSGVGFKFVIFK